MDAPIVQFNLDDLLNDIIRLSRRFASLKKVTLEITIPQESMNITNSPFSVQHAIFSCLNLALDFSISNDIITIKLEKEESQAIINVMSRPIAKNEQTKKKVESISLIINNVGGKIDQILINDESQITKLTIPLSIPDRIRENKEDPINEY